MPVRGPISRIAFVSYATCLLILAAIPCAVAAAAHPGLLARIEAEDLPFEEVEISDDLVVYFHQRVLGAAVVEKDYIVYQFSRATGDLLARKSHWREDLPDTLPAIRIAPGEAAARAGGSVESTRLFFISPDSDVFPFQPVPRGPCWIVKSREPHGIALIVVDAMTGKVLGEGVPPPTSGYALTGPTDFQPCGGTWRSWSENAAEWFTQMGYPAEAVIWPTKNQIAERVTSDDALLFYELAHGWYEGFINSCPDGQYAEETTPYEIAVWIAGSRAKLFTFLGSCDGMCETGPNTLSYEFRKGSSTNTTTVGYCGMSTSACDDCWTYSLGWQDQLFLYISLGHTTREAFDLADADYPMCALNACMRFAGDEQYSLLLTEGACCVGTACQMTDAEDCSLAGGEWFPMMESCDPDPCTQHACCLWMTCQMMNLYDCTRLGGELLWDYSSCDPDPCLWGGCCFEDSCVYLNAPACEAAGGVLHEGVTCDPLPCIEYACCLDDTCALLFNDLCIQAGGELFEGIATCDPNPCVTRACCVEGVCQLRDLAACNGIGGEWFADHETCDPYLCLPDSLDLSGGVLIAHAPPGIAYSAGTDYCALYANDYRISNSHEQVSRIDPSGPEVASVWYVLAAWSEPKVWCQATFGLGSYDTEITAFGEWAACSGGGLLQSSPAWPGPGEGLTIAHASSWSGNFEPVCWLVSYVYGAGQIPLAAYEIAQTSGLRNCEGLDFAIDCYGTLGLLSEGSACHPAGGPSACCVSGGCQMLSESECLAVGGIWLAGTAACDPDPCSMALPEGRASMPRLRLDEGAPNPFWSRMRIGFEVPPALAASPMRLDIHDAGGRLVRTLLDGPLPPGLHEAVWDGRNDRGRACEAGIYFYRLSAGGESVTRRVLFLK